MGNRAQIVALLLAAALSAALVAGCGSGGSSSAADTGSSSSAGGSSAEFVQPGGENKVAKFGKEASDSEREAASAVLEESMRARAAGDWNTQCALLASDIVRSVKESSPPPVAEKGCPKQLEAQAQPLNQTKTVRANTMTGPIAVLRVEGDSGFALYHGTKGQDYSMPMRKDDGEWKVASLVTREIP
jgi:hypothetical protein